MLQMASSIMTEVWEARPANSLFVGTRSQTERDLGDWHVSPKVHLKVDVI